MKHLKNKKERIIRRNQKRDRIKKISRHVYNPYMGYPIYADRKLRNFNYLSCLEFGSVEDWHNKTGIFEKEPYYIQKCYRSKYKKFLKRSANKKTRKNKDFGNFGKHKKNFDIWWELL